jgi:hypothetical protein
MNLFDALNHGDASLKETHLTSFLFYLFKETKIEFPESSFMDYFISSYLLGSPTTKDCALFDVESDIKIEEILSDIDSRRDSDITIYLKQNNVLNIVNIENKISNLSYQNGQIQEQNRLLKIKNPGSIIKNILLLPYSSNQTLNLDGDITLVYWLADANSLVQRFSEYVNRIINDLDTNSNKYFFLKSSEVFLQSFANQLDQERLSNENVVRGPRNNYRHSMYEYLVEIKNNWENIFPNNPDNVTVRQLLLKFEELVSRDLIEDDPLNAPDKIAKFKRGALEAQPKIMTINEKLRIHFGRMNSIEKQLFYYPDAPNGNYQGRWKDTRIKPLNRLDEENEYMIFWKNDESNEIETSIYQTL